MQEQQPNVKKLRESIIQKKVIDAFERAGWLVVKIIQTNKNGWPDLQCLKDSRVVFIECKKEGKIKIDPLQNYRHNQIRKQGFLVKIINDTKQIQNVIEICNFLQK